ncbi:MAG TPA: molybdate ABC transporter substrate-binding protein [Gaiellaceae bacterium]|nr:molybdate ABC transporter substrate-binding protein [Gaiellaceae bacterium]HVC88282.1 molybdate ABC transporter substrate-binding protein [Gaiellaceae bacterium]
MKLLAIFAAASLTGVFPQIDKAPRYQFAGSDQLAFQILQGAPADVFAAAAPKYPQELYARGKCWKPVVFATNTVVLIVPRANPAHIRSVYDLRRPGIKLVVGAPGVPIGDYTRKLLAKLKLSSVLGNIVSNESDVKFVVAKVALGEADAGFAYKTDVKAVGSSVRRIALPAAGQPTVQYELCIVRATKHLQAARAYVREVLSPRGREKLKAAGFGLP